MGDERMENLHSLYCNWQVSLFPPSSWKYCMSFTEKLRTRSVGQSGWGLLISPK